MAPEPAPTQLLAIRHGQTDWNVEGRLQGHRDIPLNDTGHAQARAVADLVAHEQLDHIYSSDLSRAAATASAIAATTGASITLNPGLRERHYGDADGRTRAEFAIDHPIDAARWQARDVGWRPPGQGAETLQELADRVADVVPTVAAEHPGQTIAIITHGGFLDIMHRLATGTGLRAERTWSMPNATINRFTWSPIDGLSLIEWGR